MRRGRKRAVVITAVALFTLVVPWTAGATHTDCAGEITPIARVAYVDARNNTGTWIYLETNGEPNLQRGGGHAVWDVTGGGVPGETDPCVDHRSDGSVYTHETADAIIL